MKAMKLLVAVAAAVTFFGCNQSGQARTYLMAYDQAPLNDLPANCYTGHNLPTTKTEYASVKDDSNAIFFDGEAGSAYLQLQLPISRLGSVNLGNIPGVIEGKDKDYSATITTTGESAGPGTSYTEATAYELKLDQTGDLMKGKLLIHYTYTSNPAPSVDAVTDCSVELPFVGRKLDHDQTLFVGGV